MSAVSVSSAHDSIQRQNNRLLYICPDPERELSCKTTAVSLEGGVLRTRRLDYGGGGDVWESIGFVLNFAGNAKRF